MNSMASSMVFLNIAISLSSALLLGVLMLAIIMKNHIQGVHLSS